jgi:hypothetical protein
MSTSLKTARDYLRSFYGLTAEEFNDTLLNKWVSLGQTNVLSDLAKAGVGYDNMIKYANVAVSTPAISTVARNGSTGVVTITTATAHPYAVGDWVIVQAVTNTTLNGVFPLATVADTTHFTYSLTGSTIGSTGDTGWTSRGYVNVPSDLLNTDESSIQLDAKFLSTAGAGSIDTYYKPLTKRTVEKGVASDPYNTVSNTYETPTTTQPFYWIAGDGTGIKSFHYRPANLEFLRAWYRFIPADLTTDSTNLSLGDEYLDLLRKWVKRLIKEKQTKIDEMRNAETEYNEALKDTIEKYTLGKQTQKEESKATEIV